MSNDVKILLTTELVEWIESAVGFGNIEYDFATAIMTFLNDDDFMMYKLKFQRQEPRHTLDTGMFYCPYIPLLTHQIPDDIK